MISVSGDTGKAKAITSILDDLIPRKGAHNGVCHLHAPVDDRDKARLMEWNKMVEKENAKKDTSIKTGDPALFEDHEPLP